MLYFNQNRERTFWLTVSIFSVINKINLNIFDDQESFMRYRWREGCHFVHCIPALTKHHISVFVIKGLLIPRVLVYSHSFSVLTPITSHDFLNDDIAHRLEKFLNWTFDNLSFLGCWHSENEWLQCDKRLTSVLQHRICGALYTHYKHVLKYREIAASKMF